MKRWLRVLALALLALGGLIVLVVAVGLGSLYGSRAQLEGARSLPGLAAEVVIERDAAGVPTITATTQRDSWRALGFLHAQERFFQMDLLRRVGGGTLAELFGPAVVESDLKSRRHELPRRAAEALARLTAEDRALVEAYSGGVNAGLAALRVRPPEYLLLRHSPRAWVPEDSLLLAVAMAFVLQDADGVQESMLGVMQRTLSPAAFAFFAPRATEWDAALDGSRLPAPSIPTAEQFTAPIPDGTNHFAVVVGSSEGVPGSNAWAVSGWRATNGVALIANDMHLDLRAPNYWFRAALKWRDPDGRERWLVGVTLPGWPFLVTGSNGEIAWGYTNAFLDESDLIELETDPTQRGRYRTPQGWQEFSIREEELKVAGEAPRRVSFTNTIWGPLAGEGAADGRLRAVRWIYHETDAWRLNFGDLHRAASVSEALSLAPLKATPVQNFVVGDRQGNIGWTLTGALPKRVGFDGRVPQSWADGSKYWAGVKTGDAYPRIENPPDGIIWTANQRVDGSAAYRDAGDGFPDNGARAGQIRDALLELDRPASPADMLAIQLDDRGRFYDRWQALLKQTLADYRGTNSAVAATANSFVESWGGRAAPTSVGFRLVVGFRMLVERRAAEPVAQLCRSQCTNFFIPPFQFEQPLWAMVNERPAHLLNRRFGSWDELLQDAANELLANALNHPGGLPAFTWGDRQRFQLRHPLGAAAPALDRWLNFPAEELPGAPSNVPRAQGRQFGASERFAVQPGRESEGIFHMPGGPSGHFLSPFYRAGHPAWAKGEATPFLPEPSRYRLTLRPTKS